jgi:hypothetical protein
MNLILKMKWENSLNDTNYQNALKKTQRTQIADI